MGVYSRQVYQQAVDSQLRSLEQHDLCFDTKTQDAWIARKGGFTRCFLQYKDYPHRIKGVNLDGNPN